MTHRPRVALVSGGWGQNIGNAFFNVGGKWILEDIFGTGAVDFIQDQPGYWTFNKKTQGNPKNYVGLLDYLDIDYIVLQGPCLSSIYRPLWEKTLTALFARGTKLILLGAAFFRYTEDEIAAAKSMIEQFPPTLISTRDSRTYALVKDWVRHAHDGIDSAFFAPYAYRPFALATPPFVALNFDRFPEPTIELKPADAADRDFVALGMGWKLHTPAMQDWFAHKGKALAYVGHFLDRRRLPERLDGHMVIRPEHRSNPHLGWKIYKQPNAICWDEPFTYFTIYANAELTLADRVHACVATLAYGKPAMLFTPSPRSALFERMGLSDIKKHPVALDPGYLEEQRLNELAFLRGVLV